MTSSAAEPVHDLAQDRLVETPESLRDADPEEIPTDRGLEAGDRPAAADRFGTTPAEAVQGQDLDHRLAEEQPDMGAHDPIEDIVAEDPATFDPERFRGADAGSGEPGALGEGGADKDLDDGDERPELIGRLIAPDEGAHEDEENEAIGVDVGPDGRDLAGEEAAMHLDRP